MEIIPDIDVTVGNITVIDFTIYNLWLQHLQANEAAGRLFSIYENDCGYDEKDVHLMLYTTVLDQYRVYGMIEPMLHYPPALHSQISFQLTSESRDKLIYDYYQFDETVIREILGKKLSKGTRRDLDEIAAKTQKPLKCCQRQVRKLENTLFDNCRRVFKAMEDMPGNLVENIQAQFLLPSQLAWNYAAITFLASQKLDCHKRRLQSLSLKTFVDCSKHLIENWTVGATDSSSQDVDIELDQEFLHELRGVKILTSDQKLMEKHKYSTSKKFKNKLQSSSQDSGWSDSFFRQLSRGLISIATSLYKTKDMRDFFIDTYEKVVEPCKTLHWDRPRLVLFFETYLESSMDLSQLHNYQHPWKRFMKTMIKCAAEMY